MTFRSSYLSLLFLVWCQICAAAPSESLSFEAVLGKQSIKIPTKTSEITPILLAIKITNKSDKLILVSRYRSAIPVVKTSDNKTLQSRIASDMTFFPQKNDFVYLAPDRSCFILSDCCLSLNANGTVKMSGDSHDGAIWEIPVIPNVPGRYKLSLTYSASETELLSIVKEFDPLRPWYGDGKTEFIDFALTR